MSGLEYRDDGEGAFGDQPGDPVGDAKSFDINVVASAACTLSPLPDSAHLLRFAEVGTSFAPSSSLSAVISCAYVIRMASLYAARSCRGVGSAHLGTFWPPVCI
ncbi:hypothetical protein GS491_26755 [Rhodococcus hoagii]|nr:hypothetical protein [Prescottella equi]NKR80721.1 hypothetical protein [Prescottella equi]NKS99534.1 hypothetical protein [Prescottella equi]